jgi:hypothetical protein
VVQPEAREHWRRVWAANYEVLTERLLAATDAEGRLDDKGK